jgi:hypothetical protein
MRPLLSAINVSYYASSKRETAARDSGRDLRGEPAHDQAPDITPRKARDRLEHGQLFFAGDVPVPPEHLGDDHPADLSLLSDSPPAQPVRGEQYVDSEEVHPCGSRN